MAFETELSLAQFKEQNPAYASIPDADLVDHLHQKYYRSVPINEFSRAIGYEIPDKPFSDDAAAAAHQFAGGINVDFNKAVGNATQAFAPEDSAASRWGKGVVERANARAKDYTLDMDGRGMLAEMAAKGARAVPLSLASLPAYAAGPVVGGLATTALFGGSQYQEEKDRMLAAGASEEDAHNAGLATGAVSGLGEVASNYLSLGMLGVGRKAVADTMGGLIGKTTDNAILKPLGTAYAKALVGENLTENAQGLGTEAIERDYGYGQQDYGDIAVETTKATTGLTALLAPLGLAGHYRNSQQAQAIDTLLADPASGSKDERLAVVDMLHKKATDLGIPEADNWLTAAKLDINSDSPIRRDAQVSVSDIGKATTVDDAIAAAGNAVNAATPAQRDRNTESELNLTNGLPASNGVDAAIANSANALNIDNINLASKSARDAQLERLIELDAANKGNRSSGYLTPIEKQEYIRLRQQLEIPPIEGEFLGKENAVGQPNHISGALEGYSIDGEVLRTQNQIGEQLKLGQAGQIESKPFAGLGGLLSNAGTNSVDATNDSVNGEFNHAATGADGSAIDAVQRARLEGLSSDKEKTQQNAEINAGPDRVELGVNTANDGGVIGNGGISESGAGLTGDATGLPEGIKHTEGQDIRDTEWGVPEKLTKPADAIPSITTENINGDQTSEKANAETRQERLLEPKAPEQSGAFVPTHELNDGTPVIQTGEDTFVDENNDEWQANDAMPIVSKVEEVQSPDSFSTEKALGAQPEQPIAPVANKDESGSGLMGIDQNQTNWITNNQYKGKDKEAFVHSHRGNAPFVVSTIDINTLKADPTRRRFNNEEAANRYAIEASGYKADNKAEKLLSTGTTADNSNQDPILRTNQKAWVKAQLKERKIKIGSPGYKAKHEELNAEYETELDKALAHAPFDVYAAHPSNKGASENILKSSHDSLRGEYGVADNLDGIIGDKIDSEWTGFHENSGSIGIPRSEMPQVKAEHRGALVNFLNAKGVSHEQVDIPAKDLKPTQAEFSPAKVEKAKNFTGGDRSILISSDNHVVDGHHQWLAKLHNGDDVKAIRLNAPIKSLVNQVGEFPSSETSSGSTKTNEQADQSTETTSPAKSKIETPTWWQEKKLAERIKAVTSIGGKYSAWDKLGTETQHALNDRFGDKPSSKPADNQETQYDSYLKAVNEAIADGTLKDKGGLAEQIKVDERLSDEESQKLDDIIYKATSPEKEPSDDTQTDVSEDIHIEGNGIERVTQEVVNESLTQADNNLPSKSKTELRDSLVKEIDAEILKAPEKSSAATEETDEIVSLKNQRKDIISENRGEPSFAHNKRVTDIEKKIQSIYADQLKEDNGQVTFDVPGDGKFRVLNTKSHLQDFKKKVLASDGFKNTGNTSLYPTKPNNSISTVIDDFLKDGEEDNAYYAALESSTRLGYGYGKNPHAENSKVLVYSGVESVKLHKDREFFVGKRFGLKARGQQKPVWAVIDAKTGMSISDHLGEASKAAAIQSGKDRLKSLSDRMNVDEALAKADAKDNARNQDQLLEMFKAEQGIGDQDQLDIENSSTPVATDYVKKESNQPENGNETNTGTKTNAGNDTGEAPNQSGISDKQPRQPEQSGVEGSSGELRAGQVESTTTDSGESQGNGLSSNEGMVGYGTDAGDQQTIKQSASKDGSVSKHLGDDNYSLIDKPNIVLSPAKRRDINILATEILKKPVEDVTEADKEVLRQYTGNGGLDLKASEDKGAGIFNQHYTSYDTIKAMYGALSDAGIKMENNLEPSVGSGNFIGMNPRAKWTAVDIDKTNTEVVERLYPDAKVFNESYETFRGKNFDLIISNVPFASFSSLAREHAGTIKPAFKAIHNFFFAQSIDKLKTGGVMAFMTSTGTMDGSVEAAKLRAHIIKDMDVVGAFRLPMGTQKANASTDVMIDAIFLQKRPDGVPSKQPEKNQSFVDIASKDGYKINKYFVDYPDSVLGDLSIGKNKTSMGKVGWIVTGEAYYSRMKIEPQDYTSTEKLNDKANDFSNHDTAQAYADKHGYKFVDQETKPYFDNGIIYDIPVTYNEQSGGGLFGRKATGANADKLAALKKIDETHDAELVHDYEVKYGKNPHSDKPLALYAKANYAEQQLKSYLALFDKHFNLSEIFTKQVRFKDSGKIEVTSESPLFDRAESLEDADGIFSTKTDLVSEDEIQELLDSGDYAKLGNGSLQNSRLYYAGNIYKKLDDANKVKPAAQRDKQIAKLERDKPALIPIKNVTVTGKESWLPDSAIASIGKRTYSDGAVIIGENAIADNHLLHLFNQYVNNEPLVKKDKNDTQEEYTDRLKAAQNILHNEVIPLIKQKIMDDGLADEVVDAYNRAKNFFATPIFDGSSLKNIPKMFKGKPFNLLIHQQEGIERAVYNKKGVLAFAPGLGKTPAAIVVADQLLQKGVMKKPLFIVPANTIPQWEATARSLYPDAKIYEFPKYTSGINKGKPKEWPSMSAADKEKMVYDLTNNRYDYTFISTNLAQKFSVPTNKLSQYLDELTESISGMEKPDDELTKSQIKAKETRLAKIRMLKATMMAAYAESTASGFDMGKMGFDALFADEVQYYKNIGMQSEEAKGGIGANVAITAKYPLGTDGKQDKELSPLSVTIGSSRSYDFRFKTRYISENNNGNNVFLLTGTPTPNKPLELMTLLHHLDTKILDEYGINNVGEFVDEFLDVQEVEEIGIDGNNKMNPQLVGIKNIFGLKKIISRYVDYRSPESASDLTRPKQIDKTHIILQNDDAEAIFADIQERILKSIEDGKAKMQGEDVVAEPMIKMYGAGRDASIDVRLYSPSKDEKGSIQPGTVFEKETRADYSKIAKTVELVAAKNKLDPEAGQLIFLDRLKFSDGSGSTHEDIRNDILKATGLSPQEVVFVNGAEYVNPITGKVAKNIKPAALQQIMDLYNDGKIKVLIGNTSKLGVGVDLQVTTTDIYQIDKPYRPDEIEQRNNRGVRQGNRNSEVTVHTFNQPGTFDAMSDRIIANKQGFNDVFWKDQESDKADVKGEEAPSHYDAAIELEQNPIKKRKLEIERDLQQASSKSNQIEKQISNLAKRIRVANENKLAYSNAIINSDKREPPKYEDQSPVERKKSLIAFKKRTADQRALNVTRVADIETDLVELEANKEVRVNELEDHKAYIADIRAKYVVNGVVSLDAIQDRINIDPDTKNKIEALESFIKCIKS